MVSPLPVVLVLLAVQLRSGFAVRTWAEAADMAATTIANLTQPDKIGILTGLGQFHQGCVGDTHPVAPRPGLLPSNGIPSICLQDGPAGIRLSSGVTGFPTGINTASTFSRRLMRARGVALGEEFYGQGINVFLGPAMDIMRNPKAGRNWESAGPDPYLTGEFAYETIQGVQSQGVMACAKHFLANNQEHWRYGLTADFLDDRTIREIYWYPFLRSFEADVSSVMCAYNRFNGTSSCHNEPLLSMLRDGAAPGTGFKGFVVSDWGATHDSAEENANAGLDMEQPGDYLVIGGGVWGTDGGGLNNAVNDGKVSVERLNQMVSNVLTPWFRLEHDQNYPAPNFGNNGHTDEHVALVREIAAASSVLLKNARTSTDSSGGAGSGTTIRGLPLAQSRIKSIAIVGQDAAMPNLNCNDLGECNDGTMSVGWGSGTNSLEYIVPPVTAISDFVGSSVTISQSLTNNINDGKAASKGKDAAIVFANADSGELGFYSVVVGNMGDRNDLELWWKGGSLIESVASVNENTIVVIHSVGPVLMPWSDHPNITAIIYAGAPGEQTGPGLVDVLWGARNPSGRLPFSIADDEDDYGTEIIYNSLGFPSLVYDEKLLLDYHYMDSQGIVPRFEFGYGLSYTTFSYSSLEIATLSASSSTASATTSKASGIRVTFTVTNTGAVAGIEIPQVYLDFPSSAGEPPKLLRGFEEVSLDPGQSKAVTVNISGRDMSIWDTISQTWVRPSGTFQVHVGASSKDIRLSKSV